MMTNGGEQDATIIGGGFYGAAIAVYLAKMRGLKRISLVEREPAMFTRASYNNQARVHNGYHYPRSFTTAYRSRVNLPKFVRDWPQAVKHDFTSLYAIARRNSKVTSKQFERFCQDINAKIQLADPKLRMLFEPRLVEDVFIVEEYAFDSTELANWAQRELHDVGVQVRLETLATSISQAPNNALFVTLQQKSRDEERVTSRYVFNCTYSGLNQFGGDFPGTRAKLKHEVAEIALIQAPPILKGLGITMIDGPFFSMLPFPARDLHTLSHVRYTPHFYWEDEPAVDPYLKLDIYDKTTRVGRMVRDVGRYLPTIFDAKYVDSLFEVKTVLQKNETDDGRPILFDKHPDLLGCYTVLGGKIDNIYDVLEKLDAEDFKHY
jgi:glycine/D-amino acid oxidase-like deaminating enzyme